MLSGLSTPDEASARFEQVRLTYRNIRLGWLGILVQAGLLEYGARHAGAGMGLPLWWWTGVLAGAISHFVLVRRFFRIAGDGQGEASVWERRMAALSFGVSAWASVGAAMGFEPTNEGWTIFLGAVLVMPGFGSAVTSGATPSIHLSWVLGSVVPASVVLLGAGGLMAAYGVAMLAGGAAMMVLGMGYAQIYRRNIMLYLQNARLADRLRIKADLAERANREKSRLLAAVSHDLRQPLHAVELFHASLARRLSDADDRRLLEMARASGRSLSEMLGELMEIARLDAGHVEVARTVAPVAPMLRECVEELRPLAEEKGLDLRLRLPSGSCVRTDPVLFKRILRNLVVNAITHTAEGGVLVGARRRGEALRIEVHDTGPGIEDGHLSHIFDEFYQVDNPERNREKGLGLGLAIVRRLSDILDLGLEVKSRPGRGSCFAIVAPLCETVGQCEDDTETSVSEDSLLGRFIVVVDDDPAILEGMRRLLRGWGCEVLSAENGEALLDELRRHDYPRPDAVVCDYRLPAGATGMDVIARVRAHFADPELPAAIISGDLHPEAREMARKAGCRWLAKPVEAKVLHQVIVDMAG